MTWTRLVDGALAAKLRIDRRVEITRARAVAYTPTKGLRLDLLRVLAEIAAYSASKWTRGKQRYGAYRLYPGSGEKPAVWCIVRQRAILQWWLGNLRRSGFRLSLCIRTLGYHLAGLKKAGYLKPESRRLKPSRLPGRKFDFYPSIYAFTPFGRELLKNRFSLGKRNPQGRLALQNFADSGLHPKGCITKDFVSSAVDNCPTAGQKQNPRKSAAARSPRSSSATAAMPRQAKAPAKVKRKTHTNAPGARRRRA